MPQLIDITDTVTVYNDYYKTVIKSNTYDEMVNLYIMNDIIKNCNSTIIDFKSVINCNNIDENSISTIKNNKIYNKIPPEGIEFEYSEHMCLVKLIPKTNFMAYKDINQTMDILYDMLILIKAGNKTILDSLFRNANIWYVKNIKLIEKSPNEVICTYWDQWCWEVLYKQPKRHMNSIYFEDEFIKNITDTVDTFFSEETKKTYERLGITYKKSFLFEGPPGTGKSSLIYGLASKYDLNLSYLQITNELKSSSLILAMRKIPSRSILVIEDIDSVFNKREKIDAAQNINFSTLLNIIDGILKPQENILIVFTSNFKNILDGALKRPGRIDEIISFDYVKKKQVKKMYKNYFIDSSEEDFDEFHQSIKSIKNLTICILQKMFLKYFNHYKDLNNINKEIIDCIEESKIYDDQSLNLYN